MIFLTSPTSFSSCLISALSCLMRLSRRSRASGNGKFISFVCSSKSSLRLSKFPLSSLRCYARCLNVSYFKRDSAEMRRLLTSSKFVRLLLMSVYKPFFSSFSFSYSFLCSGSRSLSLLSLAMLISWIDCSTLEISFSMSRFSAKTLSR